MKVQKLDEPYLVTRWFERPEGGPIGRWEGYLDPEHDDPTSWPLKWIWKAKEKKGKMNE